MLTSIGGDIVTEKLGVDIVKAGEYAQGKIPATDEAGLAVFKIYQARKRALDELKRAVASLTKGTAMRILLLVDELDRCRPAYAIEYLEALKHLFDDPNCTVLIGMDSKQMASSARCLFGADLDFDEYFRKFAHRRISLPSLNAGNSKAFCQGLVARYFDEEDPEHKYYAKFDQYRIENIAELFTAFGLSARQTHEVMRVTAHSLRVNGSHEGRMLWGWHVATMFMAVLSICRKEDYKSIGRGSMAVARVCEIADMIDGSARRHSSWWKLVLLAAYLGSDTTDGVAAMMKEAGITEEQWEASKRLDQIASEAFQRWGWDTQTPIASIFSKIESLESFVR